LTTLRGAAAVALVATEASQAAVMGPATYNLLQQNYVGTYMPQLLPTLGVLALLVFAVACLLVALGSDTPRPPRLVRLAGSTTLGCYVVHMYFTLPLSLGSWQTLYASLPERLGYLPGLLVQLAWLLGAPLLFQLSVGAVCHKLLMLEMKLLLAAGGAVARMVARVAACVVARVAGCAAGMRCGGKSSSANAAGVEMRSQRDELDARSVQNFTI